MRGHVAKKGTRYYPVIDLGRQSAQRCQECRHRVWLSKARLRACPKCNGPLGEPKEERRQHWGEGHRNKKSAETALTDALSKQDRGTYGAPSKQSLSDFIEDWLPAIKSTIRPSTFESYERLLRTHVLPRIGGLQLAKLSGERLNTLYGDLLEAGRVDGRGGLSAKSVRYIHTIIHRVLRDAGRWGKLHVNAADQADPPRNQHRDMKFWEAAELRAFLDFVKEDRLYPAWLLASTTGMRRGEVLGLTWSNVDLEQARVHITQSLGSVRYKLIFSEPKTKRGRRSIDIDPSTLSALKVHKKRQLEDRLAWGEAWTDNDLVFTREDGSPIHPDRFQKVFEKRVRESSLSQIRFHDLRHTYATLALEAGMRPWDLADRLGHASVSVTFDTYRHAVQSSQRQAALEVAQTILSG